LYFHFVNLKKNLHYYFFVKFKRRDITLSKIWGLVKYKFTTLICKFCMAYSNHDYDSQAIFHSNDCCNYCLCNFFFLPNREYWTIILLCSQKYRIASHYYSPFTSNPSPWKFYLVEGDLSSEILIKIVHRTSNLLFPSTIAFLLGTNDPVCY